MNFIVNRMCVGITNYGGFFAPIKGGGIAKLVSGQHYTRGDLMKIPALSAKSVVWLDADLLMAVTTKEDKVYLLARQGLYEAPTSFKQWVHIMQHKNELIQASRSAYVRPDLALKYDKNTNTLAFDTIRGEQLIKVSRGNQERMSGLF